MIRSTRLAALFLLIPCLGHALERPNILWLVAEDHSPLLGCYGDSVARTHQLDALAARSLRYRLATSNAPVCAPARTTLISGMHASSTGSDHMRSKVPPPSFLKLYPELMREAGYRCTNRAKEDYNFTWSRKIWDDSSPQADHLHASHAGPFLAVINQGASHESHLHHKIGSVKTDPAQVVLPPYFPDAPELRTDLARYHDQIEKVDEWVGKQLKELEDAGLSEDTVVFFFSDHGNGLPRSKRYPGWSGLHVPLMIYFPEKWRHLAPAGYQPGQSSDRLVSFVDFAPTLLSLAGAKIPSWMQGRAFLGHSSVAAADFAFGFRGRMDERPDTCRSVTNGRYVYIRNFQPHRSHGQNSSYQQSASGARKWRELYRTGKLDAVQSAYWRPHPPEELFDLQGDPHETKNLAHHPAHAGVLAECRAALRAHLLSSRDLALMPEPMMHHYLAKKTHASPWDLGQDQAVYPLEKLLAVADLQLAATPDQAALKHALVDASSLIRYWAVVELLHRESKLTKMCIPELIPLLDDPEILVRVVAAEAMVQHGGESARARGLDVLLRYAKPRNGSFYTAVHALDGLDRARPLPAELMEKLSEFPRKNPGTPPFAENYMPRLLEAVLAD